MAKSTTPRQPIVSKYYQSLLTGRIYHCILVQDNFAYLKDCKLQDNPKYKWTRDVVFLPDFWKDYKLVND